MGARVILTDEIRALVRAMQDSLSSTQFAKKMGVPVSVVRYVLRRKGSARAASISTDHLERLTKESFTPARVDTAEYAKLARLWSFVHDISIEELADRLKVDARAMRADKIKSIDFVHHAKLVEMFRQEGIGKAEAFDLSRDIRDERLVYDDIKPLVERLKDRLGVGYNTLLGRDAHRNRTGKVRTVPYEIYRRLAYIDKKTGRMNDQEREFFRAALKGREPRYLYAHLKPMLAALEHRNGHRPRYYLGRNAKPFENGELRTVSERIGRRIVSEYDRTIGLPLALIGVLRQLIEKAKQQAGCVKMELAHLAAGMGKEAFDRYVAGHLEEVRPYVKHCQFGWEIEVGYLRQLLKN